MLMIHDLQYPALRKLEYMIKLIMGQDLWTEEHRQKIIRLGQELGFCSEQLEEIIHDCKYKIAGS